MAVDLVIHAKAGIHGARQDQISEYPVYSGTRFTWIPDSVGMTKKNPILLPRKEDRVWVRATSPSKSIINRQMWFAGIPAFTGMTVGADHLRINKKEGAAKLAAPSFVSETYLVFAS